MIENLKASIRNMNLYKKLCTIFVCIFLTAIILITVTSGITSRTLAQKEVFEYTDLLLKELDNSIEYILTDTENISRFILYDDRIQAFLNSDKGAEYNSRMEAAEGVLISSSIYKKYLQSIIVLDLDGSAINVGSSPSYVSEGAMLRDSPWIKDAISKEGMYVWSNVRFAGDVRSQTNVVLTRVINARNSRVPLGMMIIILDNNYLNGIVDALNSGERGYFFVFNEMGEMILPTNDDGKYNEVMEDLQGEFNGSGKYPSNYGNYLVTRHDMAQREWSLYGVIRISTIFVEYRTNLIIIITVGIVCTLLAIVIYARVTRGITDAINNLILSMKHAEEEEFKEELALTRHDEIGLLTKAYNMFIRRINILVNEVYEEKLRTREAELSYLQAQVNPHFLYNTLNCINWKALEQKQHEISKMVVSLSQMFRFSLSSGHKEVTLRQETENVRDYLFLQQCRYDGRLKVLIEIPDSLLDIKIPKFTLQPIVENSILHGIGNSANDGRIHITAFETEGAVVIDIADNGPGADLEKIENILTRKENKEFENGHGNGIRNVNARLKLCYGEEYGLSFSLPQTGGTKVGIRIPGRRN